MTASVPFIFLFPFFSAWYFWFNLVGFLVFLVFWGVILFFFCFCFWFGLTLQLWAWNPGSCQAWQGSATFPACCSAALNLWVGQQLSLSPATLL